MNIISYLEPEDASPAVQEMYKITESRFEMVLNIFKTLGHAEEIALTMTDFILAILKDGLVDWKTKELLILKSTLLNECNYCVTQHEAVSSKLGIPDEKVADLKGDKYKTSPHFNEAERAILDLNYQIWKDANRIPSELWDRIKVHWSDPQIVEITATITAYIMISKFGDALGVGLEPAFKEVKTQLITWDHHVLQS
ncbi:MAG: carboxymuconolactone decarboxylase family protein [Candidatus Heimdallarchaeota archaeon]|nr:carboxymuconolactone decarboxylase family protein [Candidatus Heimdallarchaeota archaeon]